MIGRIGRLLRGILAVTHENAGSRKAEHRKLVWRMDDQAPNGRFVDTVPTSMPPFADTVSSAVSSSGWLMSAMDLVDGVEVVESEEDIISTSEAPTLLRADHAGSTPTFPVPRRPVDGRW